MAKKNNYDSEFCGSLPLSHINVIQDYGYLMVVSTTVLEILQVSENCRELLGREPAELIQSALSEYGDTAQLQALQARFAERSQERIPLTLTIGGQRLQTLAHFKLNHILLEIEKPEQLSERPFMNVFEEVKYAMAAIEATVNIEEASQAAVHEFKKISGFDGVMMYRFDEDWNGTVIAEEKAAGLEHYLGHTFPASDVPKQARELYLKNPYRLIPDRDFQAIRLYPVINPVLGAFSDLSDCNLRGVAAVHLEYLKNMNVSASMSVRVIHNGKLWGLIACHHLTPHYLNFELCSVCELLSSVISNHISGLLNKNQFDAESELQQQQTALIAQVYAENDLIAALFKDHGPSLLTAFQASGAVASYCKGYHTIGTVPQQEIVENLLLWLQNLEGEKVFSTDQLPDTFEEILPQADVASGLLAIPVHKDKGEFILVFRPEIIQTINWGGDPGKSINFEPDGTKYHPRASFAIWRELVRHTSAGWTPYELKMAENLRAFIFEFRTKQINA